MLGVAGVLFGLMTTRLNKRYYYYYYYMLVPKYRVRCMMMYVLNISVAVRSTSLQPMSRRYWKSVPPLKEGREFFLLNHQ